MDKRLPHLKGTARELIDALLEKAVSFRASDVHIEPMDNMVRIRLRIDGVLMTLGYIQRDKLEAMLVRLKVLASLDIAMKRLPQDGRFFWEDCGRRFDLRLSTMPTIRGEKAVLRILDAVSASLTLTRLGLTECVIKEIRSVIRLQHGLFIVSGPTGSGKSTTLYAILHELDAATVSIATLEDPVEYKVDGFCQSQVHAKGGVEFHNGLRALLRQDPDILVIGEIRDRETAEIAVRASLTGHLVLTTLHASSALDAVTRLLDMGIEAYLVADALSGIAAQRLARRLCPQCRSGGSRGPGCAHCHQCGYYGRFCLCEIVPVRYHVRAAVRNGAGKDLLSAAAIKDGALFFHDAAAAALQEGLTDADEIDRVCTE